MTPFHRRKETRSKIVFSVLATVLAGVALTAWHVQAAAIATATQQVSGQTAVAAAAAEKFLASLDASQRGRASYAFGADIKSRWHNLPPRNNDRAGLPFSQMNATQRAAAEAVLTAVLSPYGQRKIQAIVEADRVFGESRGGGGFATGPGAYMLAIFGTPSTTSPWGIQYGGHHLGLNVTFVGPQLTAAPTLTAAQPNVYTRDGKTVVVLADEAQSALTLMQSLSAAQRAKAISPSSIRNFVLGPGRDGQTIQPEGLKGSEMTAEQRERLAQVAAPWVRLVPDSVAEAKMAEIRSGLNDTYFLWSGDTSKAGIAYFRVQGPTVHIEYSPQGGDVHVHTVYRDYTNDYGRRFIAATR